MDEEGRADNTAGVDMNGWNDYSPWESKNRWKAAWYDGSLAWAMSVMTRP